jgi:hypothetical protein
MTDTDLLAEVRSAVEDWERASARRVAAIRAAKERATRATSLDDVAAAAKLTRNGMYKLLGRHRAATAQFAPCPEQGVGDHDCTEHQEET